MRVPDFMFAIVNPVVKLLLSSPLHGLASKSLMVIYFTGRKTGASYSTPVRYLRYQNTFVSFSSEHTAWWRNLRDGASATILIEGDKIICTTRVIEHEAEKVRDWLLLYFKQYPQDATYHNVSLQADGSVNEEEMAAAAEEGVVVIATPVS